ncbi:pikachurin [Bacillus rossius redtenbacheri]|uniref:pikachurin n=1 Tax=Bacillus rossius redtenbacheri TaxID=93214 RepID=UPI002FDED07D
MRAVNTRKLFRIVNYKLSINMRFRTTSESGLLLWSGRRNMTSSSDCVALGLSAGRLHFRFNLGGGEARVDYNYTVVSDGLWHRLKATSRRGLGLNSEANN